MRAALSTGGVILLTLAGVLFWGVVVEPHWLDTQKMVVHLPNLPPEAEGKELALLADFQIGMWLDNDDTVEDAVEEIIARKPAAVLIAGDFIYHPNLQDPAVVEEAVALVAPLPKAGIPTYAVLGNHDYSLANDEDPVAEDVVALLVEKLEEAGIERLNNESVLLDGLGVYLVGLGSSWAENVDVRQAFAEVPADAPRVVMMHNPEAYRQIPPQAGPFAVAGHTHGGQIRIPFLASWSWLSIVKAGEVHADGWVAPDYGQPGNRLYVNRGIGFSNLPIRINCLPELSIFTLQRGPVRERDGSEEL